MDMGTHITTASQRRGPNGGLYGIEGQGDPDPAPRHADRLAAWCELTGARGLLACRTNRARSLARGLQAVPWHFCVAG